MAKFVPQAELPVSEQAAIRREKLAALQAEGRDPFQITKFDRTHTSKQITEGYTTEERTITVREEEQQITAKISPLDGQSVTVAGRIMSKRGMGKVGFLHIADIDGQIQLFVKKEQVDSSNSILLSQDSFGYSRFFVFPYKL